MTDRIIDISDEPAKISFRNSLLVIAPNDKPEVTIPIAELASIVVSNQLCTLTHPALANLASAGVPLIVCDEKHLPAGMLLPLVGNFTQTERFQKQAQAPLPLKKRLWQQIVSAKIATQGELLKELYQNDCGLIDLSKHVKSGDQDNLEAKASRIYWQNLFKDTSFKRLREAEDQNRFLNYGYTVLRATVARAICAAGLHPSLGIHHHNRYDAFCLADDLMEPFRTIVDRAVVQTVDTFGANAPMDKNVKGLLLEALAENIILKGESRSLFDVCAKLAQSLVAVYIGERKNLFLP